MNITNFLLIFLLLSTPKSTTYIRDIQEPISANVSATVYHAVPEQTNADYLTTASMRKINEQAPEKHRWVAVSRDLEPLGFTFGKKIRVIGAGELDGIWTIEDRMNKRWKKKIDFLVNKKRKGGKWNNVTIIQLPPNIK